MESTFLFSNLCKLLNILTKTDKRGKRKLNDSQCKGFMTEFIQEWSGNNIYPAFRLLLPHLDYERPKYNIKELTLAKLYSDVMGLGPNEAQSLKKYLDPNFSCGDAGDFIASLRSDIALRKSSSDYSECTIADVNGLLDELYQARDSSTLKSTIINRIYNDFSAQEQAWIAQMILKKLHFRMSDNTIMNLYNPHGLKQFQLVHDLKLCCNLLVDPSYTAVQHQIQVFCRFQAQLSARCDKWEDLIQLLHSKFSCSPYYMQIKLDGWRVLLHYKEGKFQWFSRHDKDYSDYFGSDKDSGSLACVFYSRLNKNHVSRYYLFFFRFLKW